MKNTKSSTTVQALSLTETRMVSGGSDTVTGKVKFIVAPQLEPANSNTTTGTVKSA